MAAVKLGWRQCVAEVAEEQEEGEDGECGSDVEEERPFGAHPHGGGGGRHGGRGGR